MEKGECEMFDVFAVRNNELVLVAFATSAEDICDWTGIDIADFNDAIETDGKIEFERGRDTCALVVPHLQIVA
jgi:hypothetical protein